MLSPDHRRLVFIVIALWVIAAARFSQLPPLEMDVDEAWSVWQTLGTPGDIVRWTPYDWPPLYYLTLAGWRELAGKHPLALRMLSVLIFLLGSTGLYRVLKRWSNHQAAVVGMLAYGGPVYSLLLSTELRGYALLLGLFPLTLWLALRYFDQPRAGRGVVLGLGLAAMFNTSFTAVTTFLILGLVTLLLYRRALWRWWLPGVVGGLLSVPTLLKVLPTATDPNRADAIRAGDLDPFVPAVRDLFATQTGDHALVWGILLGGATALALFEGRRYTLSDQTAAGKPRRAALAALIIWVVTLLPVLYVTQNQIGFFNPRYSWIMLPGYALLIGRGSSRLSYPAAAGVAILCTGLMFAPGEINALKIDAPPLESSLRWLRDHLETGDVVLVDPALPCAGAHEWEVLTQVYFPAGLHFVDAPTHHRRVWYVKNKNTSNAALQARIEQGRVAGRFVGPPTCLFRVYERPPLADGILFDNGMRFHGHTIISGDANGAGPVTVRHEGEALRVRLWWSADHALAADYSVGLHLVDPHGQLVAQSDAAPQVIDGPHETSRWAIGPYYSEERTLTIPNPTGRGEYRLMLVVYQWWDNTRIPAPGVTPSGQLNLQRVDVWSW